MRFFTRLPHGRLDMHKLLTAFQQFFRQLSVSIPYLCSAIYLLCGANDLHGDIWATFLL